jgi:hypothetical protein
MNHQGTLNVGWFLDWLSACEETSSIVNYVENKIVKLVLINEVCRVNFKLLKLFQE